MHFNSWDVQFFSFTKLNLYIANIKVKMEKSVCNINFNAKKGIKLFIEYNVLVLLPVWRKKKKPEQLNAINF